MGTQDLDEFVERYHEALDEFFRGNPEPTKSLYSHAEDASLANPFGPVAIGWQQIEQTMTRAASNYRDGRATGFETLATHVTPELAYLVELERFEAKVGARQDVASGRCASPAFFDRRRESGRSCIGTPIPLPLLDRPNQ